MNRRNNFAQTDSDSQYFKRILIIEQSESLSTLYKSILLQANYTILIAPSGQKALNTLDSFKPHLIITPETLTDMKSTALQRYIGVRCIGSAEIPLLVLSPNRKPSRTPRVIDTEPAQMLYIPFKIADLRQVVEDLLGNNHVSTQNYYYPSREPLPQEQKSISA